MLFYIDYLDHITSGTYAFNLLAQRLRFDLLVFCGNDTLCMSVPACVKIGDTTKLLMELDPFWKAKKIVLQLDKKHKGKAANYFNNRKRVLAGGMPEEKLIKHFEFVAYENKRTYDFFNVYLPEIVGVSNADLFIDKANDTDALFRSETIEVLERHHDSICETLDIKRSICFSGMTNRISSLALDKSNLFQRAVIEENIIEEFRPVADEKIIIATLLDRSFALANAYTSNATPLSLVLNQLTGKWLSHLLYKSYNPLYSLLCRLNWDDVFSLSQDNDWRKFVSYINAYIFMVQESAIKKQNFKIDNCISRLSHSISLFSLLRLAKKEALDAAKNKLYEYGLFSEAQNMEMMIDLLTRAYSGNQRRFLEVLCAIELTAKRIEDKLIKDKQYSYLIELGGKQKAKKYDLLL